MTLDVLIATHRPEGILRVANMNLPTVNGVRYIVSWQASGDTPVPPVLSDRPDIEIHRVNSIGLSRNRNHGISVSKADIYLIADDDLHYTSSQLREVVDAFSDRPQMDIAVFRYNTDGNKKYPPQECPLLPYPKGYFPTSFEIAVRRSPRTTALRFDERFGLASGVFHSGEEDIFILKARDMGLDMRILPITVTHHDGPTTGTGKIRDCKVVNAMGALIVYLHPLSFPLRIPLKALRLSNAGQTSFTTALTGLLKGAFIASFKVRKPWRE